MIKPRSRQARAPPKRERGVLSFSWMAWAGPRAPRPATAKSARHPTAFPRVPTRMIPRTATCARSPQPPRHALTLPKGGFLRNDARRARARWRPKGRSCTPAATRPRDGPPRASPPARKGNRLRQLPLRDRSRIGTRPTVHVRRRRGRRTHVEEATILVRHHHHTLTSRTPRGATHSRSDPSVALGRSVHDATGSYPLHRSRPTPTSARPPETDRNEHDDASPEWHPMKPRD